MTKKVLIIGCSFANGSYESKVSGKLGEGPTDERISSIGWYDHLEILGDRKIDVYSMPGLGWLAYAHLLRELSSSGSLLQYDLLLIQETFEPRFNLLGNQFMSEFLESKEDSRTLDIRHMCYKGSPSTAMMTCNAHDGVSFYKDFVSKNRDAHTLPRSVADRLMVDISGSEFVRTMLISSQELVSMLAREAGIKIVVVSFSEPHMACKHSIVEGPYRLMHNIYPEICLHARNEYLTEPSRESESYGGRLTLNGNKLLGLRFNHLLKKIIQT